MMKKQFFFLKWKWFWYRFVYKCLNGFCSTLELRKYMDCHKKKYNASSDSFALAFEKKDRKWKEIFTLSPSSDVKLLPRSTLLQLGSTMARRKHYSDSDVGLMSFKIQRILHKGEIFSWPLPPPPPAVTQFRRNILVWFVNFVWHGRGVLSESLSYQCRVAQQSLSS